MAGLLQLLMAMGASGFDVYIRLGDSIFRGNSTPPIPGPTPLAGTMFEWDGNELIEITTNDLADASGGSPWPSYCISRNAITGRIQVVVNCAQGGSTITPYEDSGRIWSATGPGSLRQQAIDKVGILLSLPGARLINVGTSGGVNDFREPVKPTAAEFKTWYQDLIDWVNTQWNNPTIYIAQIVSSGNESQLACDMRKKILELESENANVYLALNTLGYLSQGYGSVDLVHFIQDGNNKAGEQMAYYDTLTTRTKRMRSLLSKFDTPISAEHEESWQTFFDDCELHGNLDALEFLQIYVSTTDKNRRVEFMNIGIPQADAAAHTPNSHVATNGIATFIGAGYIPATDRINATQDDIFFCVKVKTITTPGTTTAGVFGTQASAQFYLLQGSAGLQYRVNDGTATIWNGKQKPSDNTFIGIGRSGTTKFLMEDAVQVHSAVAASTSTPGRPVSIGARNLNFGSNDLFCAGEFEVSAALCWSLVSDYGQFLTDLEAHLTRLKA